MGARKQKPWTMKQRRTASAMADAGRQLLNMIGHAGHVHKKDACVQKFLTAMDAFENACFDANPDGHWHGEPPAKSDGD